MSFLALKTEKKIATLIVNMFAIGDIRAAIDPFCSVAHGTPAAYYSASVGCGSRHHSIQTRILFLTASSAQAITATAVAWLALHQRRVDPNANTHQDLTFSSSDFFIGQRIRLMTPPSLVYNAHHDV
jgi:hypothetical protein